MPGIYQSVAFDQLPGWASDAHGATFEAFMISLAALSADERTKAHVAELSGVALSMSRPSDTGARIFFETHFVPHRVGAEDEAGFLTAYYEPVIAGSRNRSNDFPVPLHRRPADLVNLVGEADRAAPPGGLTHARRQGNQLVPYPTRAEIDGGALAGQDLELLFVADEVERFLLQVQGSGLLALDDGTEVRVTYDAKNGHPYTSLGRVLVDAGTFTSQEMSLEALAAWLRADRQRGQRMMWQNRSYVFFRELGNAMAPIGVLGTALTPLRSLAIDPFFHALGLPIFVDAPDIRHMTGTAFRRLMVAQDVGSAIRGTQRGDIFAGSGADAGRLAGITKHGGHFYVLLPRSTPP